MAATSSHTPFICWCDFPRRALPRKVAVRLNNSSLAHSYRRDDIDNIVLIPDDKKEASPYSAARESHLTIPITKISLHYSSSP
jgi:hypothetical protein